MSDNAGQNVGAVNVKMGLDSTNFKNGLAQAQSEGNAFAGKFGSVLKGALGGAVAGFTLNAVISQLRENYQAAEEAEKIERQLAQSLLATGYAAGLSQNDLIDYASELQDLTGVNDEVIKSGENILLTFRNINGEVFKEGTQLALDMSTTMGTDLNSAIVQVGKALNDPIQGINALRRVGVSFTQQQKDQVKELIKSGNALEAQKIILNELKSEFGGAAEAAKTSTMTITTQLDDLREELGRLVGTENSVTRWLASMTKGFKDWAYNLRIAKSEIKDLRLSELQDRLKKVYEAQNAYNNSIPKGAINTKQINDRNKAWDDETKSIMAQIKATRERDKANAETGKQTQSELSFNTGKESKSKTNKALDEYKSFVDRYKDATNEYQAAQLARQKIGEYNPKTDSLGLQNIGAEREAYQTKLDIYKDYYKDLLDIEQSGAANKASLRKMAETKLEQDLATAKLQKAEETEQKYLEIIRKYQDESIDMQNQQTAENEAGGYLATFQTGYSEKLNVLKWYLDEKQKLIDDSNVKGQQKQDAFDQLELMKSQKLAQVQVDIWQQRGHDIAGIFGNSLDSMLTSYGGFSASMQQLGLNLMRYMLKIALEQATKEIEIEQIKTVTILAWKALTGFFTGGTALSGGATVNPLQNIRIAHSGGTIPNSANASYSLPGTKEQLALLKGGETVLSPAESTSYNNQQGQGSTIIYAPQVRAMDDKSVAQWFNDNKYQIINIIGQARKDNTGGLRTIFQGS